MSDLIAARVFSNVVWGRNRFGWIRRAFVISSWHPNKSQSADTKKKKKKKKDKRGEESTDEEERAGRCLYLPLLRLERAASFDSWLF